MRSILILLMLMLLSGCISTLPQTSEPPAGSYRVPTTISYNMAPRTFLLHVPPDYHSDTPLPLVVVIHGAFSTGVQTEAETGFSDLADAEHFLVAYPEGIGILGLLQHWNAGHCCGKAADDQVDDIGFVTEVIRVAQQKLAVDPDRIYMAGMSNGGMLTYRYAVERTGDLAAAAVVSGAIGSTMVDETQSRLLNLPERPLPIIVLHGRSDDTVPVDGGFSPRKQGKRSYLPVADAIDFWRKTDGCETTPVATNSRNGSVHHLVWGNCQNGSAVEYFMLEGWGHQWPAPWFTSRLDKDHSLRGFDATRQIWSFFKRFRRTGI